MQCADKSEFGVLGMAIFLGWMLSSLVLPRLADLYGRKLVFVVNILLQLVALAIIIYAETYTSMLVGLFTHGVCCAG